MPKVFKILRTIRNVAISGTLVLGLGTWTAVSAQGNATQATVNTNNVPVVRDTEAVLNFYNWSDYIDPTVLKDFEKETGIKVNYDLMNSNEILEAKLFVGNSGYDIVAPSIHVLKRLADAKLLMPLNKAALPNLSHLDKNKMEKISEIDINNTYGIPYMELSTGIAYNVEKVQAIMGKDFKVDSWSVLFKPEILKKLSECRVSSLDSASDMLCTALIYLNRNPESTDKKDYDDAANLLKLMGKNVAYFNSSKYVDDLASGEICMAVSWAGDAQLANERAKEAKTGTIKYIIPKEGALMGYDMLAIPKDAPHPNNAHIFLNYIMRPDVIAKITNYIHYANANADATKLVLPEIRNNPGIYYTNETLSRMHIVVPPTNLERLMNREWNTVISESAR